MAQLDYQKTARVRTQVHQKFGAFLVPEKSYLILMAPRSGSYLLCADLEKTGNGNPVEAFHLNANSMRRLYGWDIDFSDPAEHLKKALPFQTVNGVFGMKVNGNQFSGILQKARALTESIDATLNDAEVFDVFFPNTFYIHLKRRNKIKQAISFSKGMQTGIWRVASTDEDLSQYTVPPIYDRQHIEACFDKLLAIDIAWENYLQSHQLDALEVWYEDLAQNYVQTIMSVYDYLQIPSSAQPEPQLKKQANRQTDDWSQRFSEETAWLHEDSLSAALAQGDFRQVMALRFIDVAYQKEENYWQSMPINRFKKLRQFARRVRRKLIGFFA